MDHENASGKNTRTLDECFLAKSALVYDQHWKRTSDGQVVFVVKLPMEVNALVTVQQIRA